MSNLKLSEAAADILNQSKANAGSESWGLGKKLNASAPQQGPVEIGTAGHKATDSNYDATKGVPTATPPGQTPPVGSEKFGSTPGKSASDYASQPGKTAGRKDLAVSPEGGEASDEAKRDRKKGPTPTQTFKANPKASSMTVPEGEEEEEWVPDENESEEEWVPDETEEEFEDEELEEASVEEVERDLEKLSNLEFKKKYGVSKAQAEKQLSGMEDEDAEKAKAEKAEANRQKVKEDIDAMLYGENLSEEFKEKATLIFEAAVESRVQEIAEELEAKYTQEFEETLELVKEDFAEKLDSYLDYVVENWMAENTLAIEKGLRTEIVEDFIGALRNVFVEHYIDIPEEKVDVVEELVNRVETLESEINEQILKNIDLKKTLSEQHKNEIINSVCEGLTLSQVEKIKSLAKNVVFESEEDFEEKLVAIKNSYYSDGIVPATIDSLNEGIDIEEDYTTKVVDPLIEQYANKISKTKF